MQDIHTTCERALLGEDTPAEVTELYTVVCPHCGECLRTERLYPAQVSHWQGEWCCGSRDCQLVPAPDADDDQFMYCPEGHHHGVNTPGCPVCVTHEMQEKGHYGRFDLVNGWTCFDGCPACEAICAGLGTAGEWLGLVDYEDIIGHWTEWDDYRMNSDGQQFAHDCAAGYFSSDVPGDVGWYSWQWATARPGEATYRRTVALMTDLFDIPADKFSQDIMALVGDFTPHCPCCGCIDIDYLIFLDDDGFTLRCDDCGHWFTEDQMEEEA